MFHLDEKLSEQPLELIEREIESLAARLNSGTARWLELLGEFDRREGWGDTGCRSTSEWVAWRCAVNPRAAREHVRVARRLPAMPLVGEAFGRGELSYSKVRALTRLEEVEDEEQLLELARHATAAQLERMVCGARRALARDGAELHESACVRWHWDLDDGSFRLDAKLAPEDGALVLEALEAARAAIAKRRRDELEQDEAEEGGRRGSAEPPWRGGEPRVTNAEAFTAVAEVALARPPSGFNGLQGGERHQVLVHVDASTLATDSPGAQLTGDGRSQLARGPGICPETVRRLACEGSLVALVEMKGVPIAIGAQRRSISPSLRRALIARDGSCRFPGCERHRFVDAHHIHHWAHGGETTLDNLVLLCRHHHRLLHEGGYSLRRLGGRLVFRDRCGRELSPSPAPPRGDPQALPPARQTWAGSGEGADRRGCVEAVLTTVLGPNLGEPTCSRAGPCGRRARAR